MQEVPSSNLGGPTSLFQSDTRSFQIIVRSCLTNWLYGTVMLMLNRMAIVVTAKQPFLDWLHSIDPTSQGLTLEDLNNEPTVYLLPEARGDEEAAACVRRHSKEIFSTELDSWWRERSDWPPRLTAGIFDEWFGWTHHSVILDLVKQAPIREAV